MPRPLAVLFVVALATPAFAQRFPTHDITPDDYLSVATITELAVSPDGKQVAYCEARWDRVADNRRSDLWVVAADGKTPPRRLTSDRANDRHPKWSTDGSAVLVLANRKREAEKAPPWDGTSQVWRVALDGTDPRAVTKVAGGVTNYDYAPVPDAVFYSTDTTANDDDPFAALRAKFPGPSYGHGSRRVSELHRLSLSDWRADRVWAKGRYIREFAVTRDGKRVGMVSAPDDTVVKSEGESTVDVWEADTDKTATPASVEWRKTEGHSPYAWLESLAWNPAGDRLAFCAVYDAYPAEIHVIGRRGEGWDISRLAWPLRTQAHVRGYGTPLRWVDGDKLGFLAESKGDVWVEVASPHDPKFRRAYGEGLGTHNRVVTAFDGTADGEGMTVVGGMADEFPRMWRNYTEPSGGNTSYLVESNLHTRHWKRPAVSHVTWKAPDGTSVGGVLELPRGYKPGTKLPLVVAIHGGPTTSTKTELSFDPHNGRLYFAAKGYAVLCPNYRGSTGYGDKFVTDLIGNENDIDVNDIIAGVQHLVKEGIADPERVGVMGWSNGGYLTNCLITRKDLPFKLKAASSGAGIVDTVAEWGFNDEPAYPRVFKKGLPWEKPDIYKKTSPTYDLGNVTTPTLIHVGGGDERCPPGHSRMLYRALKEYLKVPTQLVEYPGEPHGLTKYSNRRAKMEWDLAWFDKYLMGK